MSTGDCVIATCRFVLWLTSSSWPSPARAASAAACRKCLPQDAMAAMGATRHPSQWRFWLCIWKNKTLWNNRLMVWASCAKHTFFKISELKLYLFSWIHALLMFNPFLVPYNHPALWYTLTFWKAWLVLFQQFSYLDFNYIFLSLFVVLVMYK